MYAHRLVSIDILKRTQLDTLKDCCLKHTAAMMPKVMSSKAPEGLMLLREPNTEE